MISELNDEEILNFLMTSEFEDTFKPEELKYLLMKFRYFYRLSNGRLEQLGHQKDSELKFLNDKIENSENYKNVLLGEIVRLKDELSSMGSRKLTLKERISGKIITKNEDK
jgi:hypothetical protein